MNDPVARTHSSMRARLLGGVALVVMRPGLARPDQGTAGPRSIAGSASHGDSGGTGLAARKSTGTGPLDAWQWRRPLSTGDAACAAPDISISADWITYSDLVFTDNKGSVTLKITANSLSAARRSTVYIGTSPVGVVQAGVPCGIASLDPASASFDHTGGTGSFTVNVTPSDCKWTAAKSPAAASWAAITSGHAGTGTGTVAYSVKANKSGKARSAKVNVVLTKGGAKKTFEVEQGK